MNALKMPSPDCDPEVPFRMSDKIRIANMELKQDAMISLGKWLGSAVVTVLIAILVAVVVHP